MIPDIGNCEFKEDCPDCNGKITWNDNKWKLKNPKLFEYDSINNIVDIFVKKDPKCPFPFHMNDWYHQGFFLKNFIIYVNNLFERYNLNYKVEKKL